MKKHNATAHDRKQANNIKYSKSCKNCPYINVDCVNTEEEIYRWECFNGDYVDLHSWEKPYPHDFGYNGDCGIIIAQSEGGGEMKTREEQIEQNFQNIKDGSLIFAWDFDPYDTPFIVVAKKENDKIYAKIKETNSGAIVLDGYRKQSDTVKEFVCKVLQIGSKRPLCLFNEYKEGYTDCLDQIKELAVEYGVEVEDEVQG